MTNLDMAHLWANKKSEYKILGNVSFQGSRFYSYSTVIAQIITDRKGVDCYLINDNTYSHSTYRHQSYVYQSIPVGACIILIPKSYVRKNADYYGRGFSGFYDSKISVSDSIALSKYFIKDYLDYLKSLVKCGGIGDYRNMDHEMYKCISGIEDMLNHFGGSYTALNKVLDKEGKKALKFLRGENNDKYECISYILGKQSLKDFRERMKPSFSKERTRKLCNYIGHHSCFTTQELDKHRKQGDVIKFMLDRKNEYDRRYYEDNCDSLRRVRQIDARHRLEKFCGMRGWYKYYRFCGDTNPFIFDYCGNTIRIDVASQYAGSIDELSISDIEYDIYTKMDKSSQKDFIREHKMSAYRYLTDEMYKIDHAEEIREKERIKAEKARKIVNENPDADRYLWKSFEIKNLIATHGVSFYHGGNVLLRYNKDKNCMETTKGISVPVNECKRLWPIINRWHNNSTTFTPAESAHSTIGQWNISKYQDDVLIAGCHAISYAEMEECASIIGLTA